MFVCAWGSGKGREGRLPRRSVQLFSVLIVGAKSIGSIGDKVHIVRASLLRLLICQGNNTCDYGNILYAKEGGLYVTS